MNKYESKYLYSASLMNQALLELLEKKDIEYITVSEITKKAGVSRTTFYLHYDNIYDLLNEITENKDKEFLNSFVGDGTPKLTSKSDAFLLTEKYLIPYLKFCKTNKRLLKLVHQKPTLFENEKAYRKIYDAILYPAISLFLKDELEKTYNLEFFTQGVVGIIRKWIELDCETEINDIVKIIINCVGYTCS